MPRGKGVLPGGRCEQSRCQLGPPVPNCRPEWFSLPAQCRLDVFYHSRPGSPLVQKIPVHREFRREAGLLFAKNQMPHPAPYRRVEFKVINPPFQALHKPVIPAQLEFPTLQLCPSSGSPSPTCHAPDKQFSVFLLCCSSPWKTLHPGQWLLTLPGPVQWSPSQWSHDPVLQALESWPPWSLPELCHFSSAGL